MKFRMCPDKSEQLSGSGEAQEAQKEGRQRWARGSGNRLDSGREGLEWLGRGSGGAGSGQAKP